MRTFWVVVADAGRALVLGKNDGSGSVKLLHELENPAGRLHTSELVSDQRGRVEKRGGGSQSAMDAPTDPHEQAAVEFAVEVCRLVDGSADQHAFDSLILIAPGHFLGLLNARLGQVARKRLVMSETKDLIRASLPDLQQHVSELVRRHSMSEVN